MIYLDHGATAFPKPVQVRRAVAVALEHCANPGRGGHRPALEAQKQVFGCREAAARLFHCREEQVVCTASCTHGLNMAIRTLVKPGDRVLISGFEHNAVTRPLHGLGARVTVAGRKLFDWQDTLESWEQGLRERPEAAVFTHVSNVFGYILPVAEMARLCQKYGVPFVVDAAQSAGILPVDLQELGADFIAMPGHKGLLGPQGTGLLLCARVPEPLLWGGTGSSSLLQTMPQELPDRAEAGTLNVSGLAGLAAGIHLVTDRGTEAVFRREAAMARQCARLLEDRGCRVFAGPHQSGTVSFLPDGDCEETAAAFARQGIALRGGLHCAPLAHESAGTLETGTLRISFGHDASGRQLAGFWQAARKIL